MLFPLVPFVLEVALVFWWVFVAAYLYSSGVARMLLLLTHCLDLAFITTLCDTSKCYHEDCFYVLLQRLRLLLSACLVSCGSSCCSTIQPVSSSQVTLLEYSGEITC